MIGRFRDVSRIATTFVCLASCLPGLAQDPFAAHVRTTPPLSPADEQKSFRLPQGFEIQLFAAEPEIAKPLNMTFDARGRLWVTNTVEYPYAAPADREAKDSIRILEDTDGDGRADRITTFADGLNIPIGLYPYQDGAIVFSIPNIWHLRDTDGDDRADVRKKLYGPFGFERDTHGLNNAFRRGFDGWLYACHGFNNETSVTGADGHTVQMHSGNTYRFKLDGSRIEQFTWGQVNPFGMAQDRLGNFFTADCHSKPLYQLVRGGYYPSFGKPHDGLGFVPPMMQHTHGSTAIAGVAIYDADGFPEEYRGNLFTGNVMTSRVNRNSPVFHGSTILAKEEPDFVTTTDPWFRPVDLRLGPDGALYVADFYNRIIGHYEVPLDHPGRDRDRGRIWRIVYTGKDVKPHVGQRTDVENVDALIAELGSHNMTRRMLALDRLADFRDEQSIGALKRVFEQSKEPTMRSHALRALERCDALDDELLASAAQDADRDVRVHAMHVLSELPKWSQPHRKLVVTGMNDSDAFVQRAAAEALGRHPQFDQIEPLLQSLAAVPAEDALLRHTIRISLRDHLRGEGSFAQFNHLSLNEATSNEVASIALAVSSAESATYLLKHVEEFDVARQQLTQFLQHIARYAPAGDMDRLSGTVRQRFAKEIDFQAELLKPVVAGFARRGQQATKQVRTWAEELAAELLDSVDDASGVWINTPVAGVPAADNPWTLRPLPSADGNSQAKFLDSKARGEQLTGILRSPAFEVPATLSFYVAGHRGFPNQPVLHKNFVRLREAGSHRLLAEATPPRNDVAQQVVWDLEESVGKQAYLEIIDGDSAGAYAWLAVGRFDPPVVKLPDVDPSKIVQRRRMAAELTAALKLDTLKPRMQRLLSAQRADATVRRDAAAALVTLEPDGRLAAIVPLLADAAVSTELKRSIGQVVVDRDAERINQVLTQAVKTMPARLQTSCAQTLAEDGDGAEALLQLVEQGHASPRLLQDATVRQRLGALKLDSLDARLEQLTANLPSANAAIRAQIQQRIQAFAKTNGSAERGRGLFVKHCAVCHRIGQEGKLVGPQLDGIGLRGLERVVEDILDPNRNVDVAFRTTTLLLDDGKVRTGLFRRQEGAVLVLVDNRGQEFTVPRDAVEQRVESNVSLMPEAQIKALTEGEFHDLLKYLLEQRTRPETDAAAASTPRATGK